MRTWVRVSVRLRVSIHEPLNVGVHWDGNRWAFIFILTYILTGVHYGKISIWV